MNDSNPPTAPVRKTDLYVIPCVCGEQVRSPARRAICPKCLRRLEVEWEAPYKPKP